MSAPLTGTGLDAGALARLRELDPDGRHGVVQRVLTAFESSLTRLLAQLEAQQQGAQASVIAALAHTLKSSSASVGALPLAAACVEVEGRLRAGTPGSLDEDVQRLLMEGRAALVAVKGILRA